MSRKFCKGANKRFPLICRGKNQPLCSCCKGRVQSQGLHVLFQLFYAVNIFLKYKGKESQFCSVIKLERVNEYKGQGSMKNDIDDISDSCGLGIDVYSTMSVMYSVSLDSSATVEIFLKSRIKQHFLDQ